MIPLTPKALQRLMQGRTVLAIAHRLATIRSFPRVIVIENGTIVEDSDPERLMRDGKAYRALMNPELHWQL